MNISEVDLRKLTVSDPFLGQYQQLVRDVVISYQWDALNDRIPEAEPSHAIENFRIAAGLQEGEFYGMVFQDSDVAKWLEAVAPGSLCQKPDAELENRRRGNRTDRFRPVRRWLSQYLLTVKAPEERWSNLAECHELYCAGHLIEAGVAFFQLRQNGACWRWFAVWPTHIDRVFGPDEDKLQGYPVIRKLNWR